MEYCEKLDSALAALEQDMIETLQRWIRVPSVRAEKSAENAPFGADVRLALDTAMADVKRLGFDARDIDGYCMDAQMGEGEDPIAVLAHLDVVPEGDGWEHDPYGAEIIDGRMIGRGTSDDKGPAVAALFAMKAIKDAGLEVKRPVRLILGCDEECGMKDLEYYEEKIGLPETGFSPDAEFPLINTEKGHIGTTLSAKIGDARLISIECGTRANVVPGTAVCVLAGDMREAAAEAFDIEDEDCGLEAELVGENTKIVVTGVPAHASLPEQGKNAAQMLLGVLCRMGIGGAAVAKLVESAPYGDVNGHAMGVYGQDEVSGTMTMNMGLLSAKDDEIRITYDLRFPVMFSGERTVETIARRLAPAGFVQGSFGVTQPHHVPENSELVTKLIGVYNEITGTNGKPYAIGGGTYAKHLKEGVAFGMLFPGELALEHQANESICVASFLKAARIYAYCIKELCC